MSSIKAKVVSFTHHYRKRRDETGDTCSVADTRGALLEEIRDSTFRTSQYLGEQLANAERDELPMERYRLLVASFNEIHEVMLATDHLMAIENHLPIFEEGDSKNLLKAFSQPPDGETDITVLLFNFRHYVVWALQNNFDYPKISSLLNGVLGEAGISLVSADDVETFHANYLSA